MDSLFREVSLQGKYLISTWFLTEVKYRRITVVFNRRHETFRGVNVSKMSTQNTVAYGGDDKDSNAGHKPSLASNDNCIPTSPLRGMMPPQLHQQQLHPLLDKSTLKVHLPNGTFNVVRFGDAADIKGIIQLLTNRLCASGECRYYQHLYAMRMVNTSTGDVHWLHQDTTMFQVL